MDDRQRSDTATTETGDDRKTDSLQRSILLLVILTLLLTCAMTSIIVTGLVLAQRLF